MAIFLTVGLIGVILGDAGSAKDRALLSISQFGVGALGGRGRLAALAVSWIHPVDAGLHPLLALAFGMQAFGLAAVLADSGFLAIYLAGILLSSRPIVVRRGIWLSENSFTMMIVLEKVRQTAM